MTRIEITNQEEIRRYFNSGHFDVLTIDEVMGDYDNTIGDYYARLNNLGECIDSNGSEARLIGIGNDGLVSIDFFVYEREYERASWEEKRFVTKGRLVLDSKIYNGQDPVYHIEQFKEYDGEEND